MPTYRRWDPKDPADEAILWFNWAHFLPDNTTITSAVVDVPAGLTLVDDGTTPKKVWFKVTGGTAGQKYIIGCSIVTNTDEEFNQDATLPVEQRLN